MSDEAGTDQATQLEEPAAILDRIDAVWREFQGAIGGMSEAELTAPGRVGVWSIKDLLAHIGRWYDAAVVVIDNRIAGRPRGETYDDFDAWNARWAEEDRGLTPAEARSGCEAAHDRLRALVADLPADRWDKVVRGWVEGSGYGHLEEHLADIRGAGSAP